MKILQQNFPADVHPCGPRSVAHEESRRTAAALITPSWSKAINFLSFSLYPGRAAALAAGFTR
jgi:hypothetical protein